MDKNEERNNEQKFIFYEFNRKIFLIEDFLELTKWSIEDFVQHLSEDKTKKEIIEKYSENFDEWYKESISFLPNFLYKSILLLIWSCFMGLLKKIVKVFGEKETLKPNPNEKRPPDYIILLRIIENLGKKINLSLEEKEALQSMNDLRNEILHQTKGEDIVLKFNMLDNQKCGDFLIIIKKVCGTLEKAVLNSGFASQG